LIAYGKARGGGNDSLSSQDERIMDTFSPEFNAYWRADGEPEKRGGDAPSTDSTLSPSQQVALEELVERVSAARSIV
jgi:hypothetical protein